MQTQANFTAARKLVRGVRFGALGHVPASFDLILGYAYLDGIVESSVLNASPYSALNLILIAKKDPRANTAPCFLNPAGFPLANVPWNSGNIFLTYKLTFHLGRRLRRTTSSASGRRYKPYAQISSSFGAEHRAAEKPHATLRAWASLPLGAAVPHSALFAFEHPLVLEQRSGRRYPGSLRFGMQIGPSLNYSRLTR